MYEVPHPSHGFFGVTVAFFTYVLLVIGVALALATLGLPDLLVLGGSGIVAVALLAVFLPLFRRLTPERAGGE